MLDVNNKRHTYHELAWYLKEKLSGACNKVDVLACYKQISYHPVPSTRCVSETSIQRSILIIISLAALLVVLGLGPSLEACWFEATYSKYSSDARYGPSVMTFNQR